uniref:Glycosyl transferase family 90 and serine/threonine-protein kinase domain protein n=1 Tax=Iridovirus LCIVAC01 TaxID=2506607 RepID=A0A481YSA5_9VIRU|nr:MAG: glycosyl transferase family 90 and serine/threonine-protein kinase domain protein [Iridovirus LCIVAC01]
MPTTTDKFQVKKDFYTNQTDCRSSIRERVATNPRYSHFYQTHFTAGDQEQFERFRDPTNGRLCIENIDNPNNVFSELNAPNQIEWDKYKDIGTASIFHTFRYIFDKFKKGIFVKIQNNELKVFLPFSKSNFTNEWSDKISYPRNFRNIGEYMKSLAKHINILQGKPDRRISVNRFPDQWYGNNCLIRYEYPLGEGDSGVPIMSNMLKELCKKRKVPDIEFFINRRDFPILNKNGTEAYTYLFGDKQPLVSHDYPKYAPIFSMVTTDKNADIPIPTWEDWVRVTSQEEGIFFSPKCDNYQYNFNTLWKNKIPTAVFRGGSTGCGTTIDTNPRLKVSYLSVITPRDKNGVKLIDAGITNWNLRPRKPKNSPYLQTIEINQEPLNKLKLAKRLNPEEQSRYKYIINVDGHVSAFRTGLELQMGSVVLLADSPYNLWYRKYLKPYVHYVPVKADLSNLIKQIQWCRNNDTKCEEIARNGQLFYKTYLTISGTLDYLQNLLINLKKKVGVYLYNYKTPLTFQMEDEAKIIGKLMEQFPDSEKELGVYSLPNQIRNYSLYEGVRWIFNYFTRKNKIESVIRDEAEISRTRLTHVRRFGFADRSLFAVKMTEDSQKKKESVHELFVGLSCTNNFFKYVPNFSYVFGSFWKNDSVNLVTEYIPGITFDQYLRHPDFNFREYVWILLQLALALDVAQNKSGFVHYDLYPWNIIIQRLRYPYVFDYKLRDGKIIRISTKIMPVIIDYGKSHCIYKNKHYGLVNPYKTSTIHDIISILVSSMFIITTKQRIDRRNIALVIKLINFIGGTKYTNKLVFKNLNQIRSFTSNAKRYTEMLISKKYELEKRTPLDFFSYILSNFQIEGSITPIEFIQYPVEIGNARQVFEYIISKNVQERIESYLNVFYRLKMCTIPIRKNHFFLYYAVQNIYKNIHQVYFLLNQYAKQEQIPMKRYSDIFESCIKYLEHVYLPLLKGEPEKISYSISNSFKILPYTQETFLNINEMLKLSKIYSKEPFANQDLLGNKQIITQVLTEPGPYAMNEKNKSFYKNLFKDILNINIIPTMISIANKTTFLQLSKSIAETDVRGIQQQISTEKGDCSQVEGYLKLYEELVSDLKE